MNASHLTRTLPSLHRRKFLQLGLGVATAAALLPRPNSVRAAETGGTRLAEDDPANTKIAHRLTMRGLNDDDLLFLQQIGLRWARLEWGNENVSLESLRATKERFAKFGM